MAMLKRIMPSATPWAVGQLFASGEQGAWYDPSDMSTLFQDSAGATPVTAVEQPVGRMLDKSGNAYHAIQATTTKRPVLSARYNLLLDTATLATQSITTLAASHRLTFSGAGSVTLSGTASGVFGAGVHTIACTAGTLTLTVSGAVNDADFRLAVDASLPYQWVNTATDYDANPAKFPTYLRFDGVDDALATVGNVDLSYTDKVTVWAGVESNQTVFGVVCEFSSSFSSNPRSFLACIRDSGSFDSFYFAGESSSLQARKIFSNSTRLLTGSFDIAAPSLSPRMNGSSSGFSVLGTPTPSPCFGNYPLYIGARAGTALYFNGRIYGLIVRGAATGMATVEAVERYLNSKVRAY